MSRLGRLIAGAVWAALASGASAAPAPACDPAAVTLIAGSGPHSFHVEIADRPEAQARGLMFRPHLAQGDGMLFVFDPPHVARFWMQNTMIPLDMIFIDDTGRVDSVAERTDTYSQRVSQSQGPVRAVLEINAGLSRQYGIGPGTQAVHAAFAAAPPELHCPR